MRRFLVIYGTASESFLFKHLLLKASEYIEAETLEEAIEQANKTATNLKYVVDSIKEISIDTSEKRSQE